MPEPPAPQPQPPTDSIVISRGTLNAVIAGVVSLVFGIAIGLLLADRMTPPREPVVDTAAIIDAAVGTAVAAVPRGPTPVPTNDPNARYEVTGGDNPSIGPANAPVLMVEFGDFRCSFCKRFNDTTLNPLLAEYSEQVLFVYRDYPILGPDSTLAAISGECADDQEKFWPMHDLMYAAPQNLTREAFLTYAADIDIDVDAFTTCLDTNPHQQEIQNDYDVAQGAGVGGTPTFFINGRRVIGAQPIEVFRQVIDQELALSAESTPDGA